MRHACIGLSSPPSVVRSNYRRTSSKPPCGGIGWSMAAILCLSVLVPSGHTAPTSGADTFRILPLFDALTGSYPTDQFVAEANRLKAQVGQNRQYFKVGFSFIYPGLASTRRYCQIAQTNNISLGVILAQQTHSLASPIANLART